MKTILVLNMGMKSIRSIAFNDRGEKLAAYSLPLQTTLTEKEVVQNPDEWLEKAAVVIGETVRALNNVTIDYITVTSSASCLVCMSEGGESLYPCLMVSDKRADAESAELSAFPEYEDVRAETGLSMDASLMLPKILWIKKNQPQVYASTRMFLSPNDFLIHMLSGKILTDYMNAQKYHYNPETKTYPENLIKASGIDRDKLPGVAAPGTIAGYILPDKAKEFGISPSCQVVVTTYDAICSFMGSGAIENGEVSDVSGTVTVFRAVSRSDKRAASNKIFSSPFYEHNMQIVGGSNNLGGGLIEWVKQCYYQNEPYPYELMEKDAREVECGAGGVVFLPYLLGERAPIWNNEARGVFFGLERMHTRKEMTRAVFESAGFIDLDMMQAIQEAGTEISKIRVSGGLARVNLISQIKADITGKEIYVLSEFETTSTGAAMLALFGARAYSSWESAVNAFVKIRMIIKPDFDNFKIYQQIYGLYKETYETLIPLFSKRSQVLDKIYRNRKVKIENL